MGAWVVGTPGPMTSGPLHHVDRRVPHPGPGQVRVQVHVCGVCRTDLHLAEGDLVPRRPQVVPGHEVVGVVDELGADSVRFAVGDRVGIPWLASTCGRCRFCRAGRENLCIDPRFTGWDTDGGYAEFAVADEAYVYELPATFSDIDAAPLLCAGIIGYRALRLCELPPGGTLGIYGFGASAHLVAQVAVSQGARLHVRTRDMEVRALAEALGAASVADSYEPCPEPLDSAILFAPAGELVLPALEALDRGGTLAVAGIHLTDIPVLDYQRHLFQERTLRSVTANARHDGTEFLRLAARISVKPTVMEYPMDRAADALTDLAQGRVQGAAVLVNS